MRRMTQEQIDALFQRVQNPGPEGPSDEDLRFLTALFEGACELPEEVALRGRARRLFDRDVARLKGRRLDAS